VTTPGGCPRLSRPAPRSPTRAGWKYRFSGPADRVVQLPAGRADVALLCVPFDDLDGTTHETLQRWKDVPHDIAGA
jgi:hypothetical protein